MKAMIETISPSGNVVRFETPEMETEDLLKALPQMEKVLEKSGYLPNAERHYPKTPNGEPICPRHGDVMPLREKQGDTWYSHKVEGSNGEEFWCRGHAGKLSPGWDY